MRRLGFGANAEAASELRDIDEAITWALDRSRPTPDLPVLEPPAEPQRDREAGRVLHQYWLQRLIAAERPIEERLVWFWHDHFAMDLRKIQEPYLLNQHHTLLRSHATGSFAELLGAVAVDPAMLRYLDGGSNSRQHLNENFGREVLELYTVGRGNFSEDDVVASARSFTGWVVYVPGTRADRFLADHKPWSSVFVDFRHDAGTKTLLGVSGAHDAFAAIEIMLEHPATADRIAAKLYSELVGLPARPDVAQRLGNVFRRDYSTMALVEAIVAEPAFLAEDAINAKVRSPLEQAVGVAQATAPTREALAAIVPAIQSIGYFPFRAPNPAGYAKGERLLSPHRLVSTFDFAALTPSHIASLDGAAMLERLGLHDVSATTSSIVSAAADPQIRWALAINSPEHHRV